MSVFCIHKYFKNESVASVSSKKFHDSPEAVYPSFSICFENRKRSGYYTEKPFHAKTSGTIPIYYSDEQFSHDFNEKAFLNLNDFDSLEQLLERVKEVDQDEKLYKDYFQEPLFTGGKIKKEFHPDSVLNFFYNTILK